jgi:hypothetical protein
MGLWRSFSEMNRWLDNHYVILGWLDNHAVELIAISLLVSLLVIWIGHREKQKRLEAWLRVYGTEEPLQTWSANQEWRRPTGIRLLEDLKADLVSNEDFLIRGRQAALDFRNRRAALQREGAHLKRIWLEFNAHFFSLKAPARGEALCEQLDRLWAGDAYIEIENWKDRIQKLKLHRGELSGEETSRRHQIDEQILGAERELRDLAEVVRRAQERAKVSPHEVQYREASEVHELDMRDEIRKTFRIVRTKMETLKECDSLIRKVNEDSVLSEKKKAELIAEISKTAEDIFSPSATSDAVSIYKKD